MSNEPKAGMSIDPELLAAYIDKRLSPEQRAAVEAQLAADPDSYALLVETLKATEALDDKPVPIPAPATRPTWVIAASVLAAAAAIALVVWTNPQILERLGGGGSSDPRLVNLYAAADPERTIEARLSGGFRYAPLRPVTRGNPNDENLALLAAAGELQRAAQEQPSVESRHAAAIGLLLTRRFDQAVPLLEQVAEQSTNARYRSDLAAAYAARAQQSGSAEDWAKSLDAAERAIALDPDLTEAWFNRALALERLFLRSRAQQAWQDYLRRDPDSSWAIEAKTHASALPQSWDLQRKQLDEMPAAATAPSDLIARNPQLVREWIEESVLQEWATAVLRGDRAAAAIRLKQAKDDGALVAHAQPGSTFPAVISAIESASNIRRIAQAHLDFLEARRLYLQGGYADSAAAYQRAYAVFGPAGSPLARTCQLYMALLPYFRGELDHAAANLTALGEISADAIVEGRRKWMLGIIAVGQGRYESALADYRSALASFESANESEGIAGLHSVLAEVLRDLGDREFWSHLQRSTELTPLVRIGRRDAIYTVGTQAALSAGYPLVARHLQEEALRNALDGGTPSMQVSAFQWMYAVLQRLGERDAAAQTLARAGESIDAIKDEGLRRRQQAELWSLQAEAALAKDASAAAELAANAIDQFSREGRVRRLPPLYLQLSRARTALHDGPAAREAIDRGLASVEQQRVDVREARLRLSYFEDKWSLVDEGISQRVDAADVTAMQSLEFLDRWRQPSLFRTAGNGEASLSALVPAMPSDSAVAAYAILPNRLAIWVARSSGVERVVVPIDRASVERAIRTVNLQLASAGPSVDARPAITALSEIVISPIQRFLADARYVAILPDGLIGEVPFAALSWGDDTRLVDHAAVFVVPRIGAALSRQQPPIRPTGTALIGAVSRGGDDELAALPGAIAESQAVASIYGARADLRVDSLTVDDFAADAPRAQVIHLAAHATANAQLPHLSRIFLVPSKQFASGALTAAEISRLRLRADVVVLSACETASGAPTRSEGVIGLASAFMSAGAASVVSSLWPSDDALSAAFHDHLHRLIQQGASPADALRETQRWARAEQSAASRPWSWATWVLTQSQMPSVQRRVQ